MSFELRDATKEEKEIIANLMQFYVYDFSVFVSYDVDEKGLFGAYPKLDEYWNEPASRFPYLLRKDGHHAGFVLVDRIAAEPPVFSVTEFFVLKKYRGQGLGKTAAIQLFDRHKGLWKIQQRENNQPAQQFWIRVIDAYTKGKFSDSFINERRVQEFRSE